jgi:hypothetical protein
MGIERRYQLVKRPIRVFPWKHVLKYGSTKTFRFRVCCSVTKIYVAVRTTNGSNIKEVKFSLI